MQEYYGKDSLSTRELLDKIIDDFGLDKYDSAVRTKLKNNIRRTVKINEENIWNSNAVKDSSNNIQHQFSHSDIVMLYENSEFLKCILDIVRDEQMYNSNKKLNAEDKLTRLNELEGVIIQRIEHSKASPNELSNSLDEGFEDCVDLNSDYQYRSIYPFTWNDKGFAKIYLMLEALYKKFVDEEITQENIQKLKSKNDKTKQECFANLFDLMKSEKMNIMLSALFGQYFTDIDKGSLYHDMNCIAEESKDSPSTETLNIIHRYKNNNYYFPKA